MQKKSQTKLGKLYYQAKNGYYRFINSNKYLHVWAAEKKYGRKLKPGEVVHHLDGNKTNNQPYNLNIMDKKKHKKLHEDNQTYWGDWNGPDFNFPNI